MRQLRLLADLCYAELSLLLDFYDDAKKGKNSVKLTEILAADVADIGLERAIVNRAQATLHALEMLAIPGGFDPLVVENNCNDCLTQFAKFLPSKEELEQRDEAIRRIKEENE